VLQKIHHLIRYFILLAIVAFIAFTQKIAYGIVLILLGPPIYLAYGLKKIIVDLIWSIPSSDAINLYGFILPITILYFGLMGFQLKQLWNERGTVRTLSLLAMVGFLFFIHYFCWKNLLMYLKA
jgi:hypothetical protein